MTRETPPAGKAGWLIDTNVVSELRRPKPDAGVVKFMKAIDSQRAYLSAITLGELHAGVALLPAGKKRRALEQWLGQTQGLFAKRVLPVGQAECVLWGQLVARCQQAGTPLKLADGLIAATALTHDLVVVTRNQKDFEPTGAQSLNPWIER